MKTLALVFLVALVAASVQAGEKEDAAQRGRALFQRAALWVASGRSVTGAVRTLHVELDVRTEKAGEGSHNGYSRLWFSLPGRMRWEMRTARRARENQSTIKVLDGGRLWIFTPKKGGIWTRMHGGAEAAAVSQAQKDRDAFASLTRYLTLEGLQGPGTRFEDAGLHRWPKGHHLAGSWRKVLRTAADGKRMAFLLAVESDPEGAVRAVRPGAILLPADRKAGRGAEHIVLTRWRKTASGRLPNKIERWSEDEQGRFARTLWAFPEAFRINQPIPKHFFQPGLRTPRAKPRKPAKTADRR